MGIESKPGSFIGWGIIIERGGRQGRGYLKDISSLSSYKQEIKFVTISIKKVHNYTPVKDVIVQKVK